MVDPKIYSTLCPETEAKITIFCQLFKFTNLGSAFSLLGIYLTEMFIHVHKDMWTGKFTETLSIGALNNWPTKCKQHKEMNKIVIYLYYRVICSNWE